MEDHEKEKVEKFTIADAFDAAQEWVFNTTRLGCLTIIGIILVVVKVIGYLDTAWINVLWPFLLVAGTISIAALVFSTQLSPPKLVPAIHSNLISSASAS